MSIEQKQQLVPDYTRDKVRTQQHFKRECDINNILKRMRKNGGIVPPSMLNMRQAFYSDVSNLGDFTTMQRQVIDAKTAFMTMSAQVRKRFNHDPAELIAFVQDNNNRDEAIELGLIPKPEPAPEPEPPAPSTPPEPQTPSA